jgi:hypothetical protein
LGEPTLWTDLPPGPQRAEETSAERD